MPEALVRRGVRASRVCGRTRVRHDRTHVRTRWRSARKSRRFPQEMWLPPCDHARIPRNHSADPRTCGSDAYSTCHNSAPPAVAPVGLPRACSRLERWCSRASRCRAPRASAGPAGRRSFSRARPRFGNCRSLTPGADTRCGCAASSPTTTRPPPHWSFKTGCRRRSGRCLTNPGSDRVGTGDRDRRRHRHSVSLLRSSSERPSRISSPRSCRRATRVSIADLRSGTFSYRWVEAAGRRPIGES